MTARPRPLFAEDLNLVRSATHVAMHPDGSGAAVSLTHFAGGVRQSDVVWAGATPGALRPLTHDGTSEAAAWSPDARRLAFLSRRSGQSGLYVLDMEGGDALQVAAFAGEPRLPAWSPDGRRIVLEVLDPPDDPDAPRVVTRLRYNVNGKAFIGDRRWRVVVVDPVEKSVREVGDRAFHHFCPAWSPDGERLALVTSRRADWDLEWVWDVYTVDLESDRWARLTVSDGVALYPAWSPDGGRIAFLHNHAAWTGTTSDYHLMEVVADGGAAPRCLSHALDRGAADVYEPPIIGGGAPVYAADGDHVFWLVNDHGRRALHRTATNGAGTNAWLCDVGWPVPSADRTRAGALMYSAERPAEVAMVDLEGAFARPITELNAWLGERAIAGPPDTLTLPSGDVGAEALVWHPPGEPSGPLPTLVQFHGGPHGAFGPYFSFLDQMLLSHGYRVANLNYRGSAGFGQAFADLVHANWGPQEGDDGEHLIDRLCALGWADPSAIGVYGISYGGFMTNWMLTRYPERVQAAVTISTVASLFTSAYGIDHWESIATDMGGLPWAIEPYYREHSPASYLARAKAPLLVLHGEADMTCPLIEAEIMFVGLRWQRKPVELVRYPGEHHSFLRSGRLETMVDAHGRILEWFNRWLRGARPMPDAQDRA